MRPTKSPLGRRGTFKTSSHNTVTCTIRAVPMPESITQFLKMNVSSLRLIQRDLGRSSGHIENTIQPYEDSIEEGLTEGVSGAADGGLHQMPPIAYEDFWMALEKIMDAAGPEWKSIVPSIWAFGPNRVGPNLLVWGCEGWNKTL